ncbi:hypothetical protein OROHE_015980 [Orobanche hederae]
MANRNNLSRSQFGGLKQPCEMIGVEDRISALPHDLITHILTYLTLKEAIATSILSKRWKELWVSLPTLDFGCLRVCKMETYVQRVDKILGQFNGPKLHRFRIVFPMFGRFRSHIDDWVSFAIKHDVSELELNFNFFVFTGKSDNYYFPARIFCGQQMLNSEHFEFLRDLCLRSVNLSDEVFEIILSRCFSLEIFVLEFSLGLVNAKNTAPHLKLKSLELYICADLEKLELLAPNLVSFKYQGRRRTLCLKDAQQLASLELATQITPDPNTRVMFPTGKNFIFSQFSSFLPKLESLVLTVHIFEDVRDFTQLCVFSNLKHLALDVVHPHQFRLLYEVAASIIRAAPYLELLELILPAMDLPYWEIEAPELGSMSRPHQNLREVKLHGFRGDKATMKFLAYLVEYAVSLEKIDVTVRGATRLGDNLKIEPCPSIKADDAKKCKKRLLQLRQTLPESAQLCSMMDD